MPPKPRVVQNKSLCFASPSYSSSSLGHAGEALLQAGQKHKTQMLCLTAIQGKEKEISLVETEFRAVLLRRDGWSQQETSFCIFTYFRRFARGRSSVWWCFTDQARVLYWTPQLPLHVQISKCSCSSQRFLQRARRERLDKGARWRTCHGLSAEPYSLQSSQPTYGPTPGLLRAHCLQLLGTACFAFQTDGKKEQKETPWTEQSPEMWGWQKQAYKSQKRQGKWWSHWSSESALLIALSSGFWASHLTKQRALKLLPTCYSQHITAVTLTVKVTVICKCCDW